MTVHRCPKCGATYDAGRYHVTVEHPCPNTDRHGTRTVVKFIAITDAELALTL
jgi:predicted  nucleic acid-binding Zn-ribbon protein